MKRFNCDFSSRFRILKGGKISLVVSALLISSSLVVSDANAADYEISNGLLTATLEDGDTVATTEDITSTDSGIVITSGAENTQINIIDDVTITDADAIRVNGLGSGSSLSIASDITVGAYGTGIDAFSLYLNAILTNNTTITNNGTLEAVSTEIAKGIYTSSSINSGSSIINSTGANISVDGERGAYGIQIGTALHTSTIENYGEIDATSEYASIGINVIQDMTKSGIINAGSIKSYVEKTSQETMGMELSSTGIALRGVYSDGAGNYDGSVVYNTNTIEVDALANMTLENGGLSYESDFFSTEATGVFIQDLNGLDESFQPSYLRNDGDITVNSKINIDFTTAGDTLEFTNNGGSSNSLFAEASGFNVNYADYATIINDGNMNVSAEVYIDESGNIVGSPWQYALSKGIGILSLSNSTLRNNENGHINAHAIFEGSDKANAMAGGIVVFEASNSELILGKITSKAEARANLEIEDSRAWAYASGLSIYTDDSDTLSIVSDNLIDVTAEASSSGSMEAIAYGIESNVYMNDGEVVSIENTEDGKISVNAIAIANNVNNEVSSESYGIYASLGAGDLSITNDGTIEAYINSELDWQGYSLYLENDEDYEGTVNVTNSGTLKGNLYVYGSLENRGTISLPDNAHGDTSAWIQNFTNKEGGILEIGLLTKGSLNNTTYSQLVTENATFENGSKIHVVVSDYSEKVGLLAGKRLEDVVTASTALTINGTLNVTDNSALLNFAYVTSDDWTNGEDGAIHLNIVQATNDNGEEITIETATKDGGGNKNTQAAAKVLNNISNNLENYPAMASVITAFNGLQTEAQIAQAVQTTTSSTPTASAGATTQISNGIAGIVTQRQNANMGSGANSGDMMFSEKNFWFKPYGSIGSQNDKDGISGFDVKAQGFGLGLDGEYKDNQNIGFGLFYTSANVDVNNVSQEANLDVFTTLVYGNVPVIDDKTNFLYQAGYSWQKTEGERKIFTGDIATSDYTSKTASIDLKLMRDVQVSDDLLLQPMVETTYRHFTNPAYKENGAGALNLNVDKFTSSDLIVGLGTLAHYKLTDDSKIVGNVNVGYDLHGKNQTVTSSFEGAAGLKFDTDGIDNGKWNYAAGIGYEKELNKTNSFNISYDYQGQGSDFSNNTVSAKYVLKF